MMSAFYSQPDWRIELRSPRRADAAEFTESMNRSSAFHHPWVTPPCDTGAFQRYLKRQKLPTECSYLAIHRADQKIAGVVNLSVITHQALKSCYLGYYAVENYAGKGLMSEALKLAINEAFGTHGLHRVEANIQPGNTSSISLVEKLGFKREGFSPRYLHINGQWRDHERWALLADEKDYTSP